MGSGVGSQTFRMQTLALRLTAGSFRDPQRFVTAAAPTALPYDLNGNLTAEPAHNGVGDYRYEFSPENELLRVHAPYSSSYSGREYQESNYDPGGNRWSRVIFADGGPVLLTLRDATGNVATEYI